ncbi:YjgB family protein [Alloiococcus sp. CFN-8]|uniref:YjgB family protein n=1 Tax=Alloiococcus sp. CFN-8 TaxID=3416081 RepID=UPI003CF415D7
MTVTKNSILLKLLITFFMTLTLITGCVSNDDNDNPSPPGNGIQTPDDTSEEQPSQSDDSKKILLDTIMNLAKEGKVINISFTLKTNVIEDVEKEWGEPETSDWIPEAKGTYSTYPSKGIGFGWNKGSQLFEIRSFDSEIKKIPLSEVKNIFGTPDYDVKVNGEEIIGYVVNEEFKILLVFPEPTTSSPDPLMDHYSVFYPRGTVNQMANDPGREW